VNQPVERPSQVSQAVERPPQANQPVERRRQSWREFRLAYPGIITVLFVALVSMVAITGGSCTSAFVMRGRSRAFAPA